LEESKLVLMLSWESSDSVKGFALRAIRLAYRVPVDFLTFTFIADVASVNASVCKLSNQTIALLEIAPALCVYLENILPNYPFASIFVVYNLNSFAIMD